MVLSVAPLTTYQQKRAIYGRPNAEGMGKQTVLGKTGRPSFGSTGTANKMKGPTILLVMCAN
jgi:hypothetical protein